MRNHVPHREGQPAEAFHIAGKHRAVLCPKCGRLEHAPDMGACQPGIIIEKLCESLGYRICQNCKVEVCVNYRDRNCEKVSMIRYKVQIGKGGFE